MLFLDSIFSHIKKVLLTFNKIMNKQQILKKIGEIIHDLNEQHLYLSKINKINILELELFTANADFLIDHIEILKKIEANALMTKEAETLYEAKTVDKEMIEKPKVEIVEEEIVPVTFTDVDEKPKKKFFDFNLAEEPAEMIFDFEKKISVEEVFDRELSNEERNFLEQKHSSQDREVSETIKELKEEDQEENQEDEDGPEPFLVAQKIEEQIPLPAPIIPVRIVEEQIEESVTLPLEKMVEEPIKATVNKLENKELIAPDKKLTLNEMLSNKLGNKVNAAGNHPQKQITDLKAAISLNDKMVFIKELFSGYNLAYSEAIEIINRFDNFDAADNFLQKNYAQKNDWENKKTTVDRLYEYLGRKFKI